MRVELGMHVLSSDGFEVGAIDKVILDPATHVVKAVALRHGPALRHDAEAPISALVPGPAGGLRLTIPIAQAAALKHFVEDAYLPSLPGVEPVAGSTIEDRFLPLGHLTGLLGPVEVSPAAAATRHQLEAMYAEKDLTNAVIAHGSEVRSRDGQRLGTMRRLAFDPATGAVTDFTMRCQALLGGEELALPATLIAAVDDALLTLAVDAGWLALWVSLAEGMDVWSNDRLCLGTVAQRALDHLQVLTLDHSHWLQVPMLAVGRISRNRIILTADLAQTLLWRTPIVSGAGETVAPSTQG